MLSTRFGEMEVHPDAIVRMPRGLMGFASLRDFALAALPEARHAGFRVLQSLEDPSLSFIVLPGEAAPGAIAREDVVEGLRALGIEEADGAVLLIVSVRRTPSGENSVSVNLRAPVMVDVKNRKAWQHVLANQSYPVRQDLAALSKG